MPAASVPLISCVGGVPSPSRHLPRRRSSFPSRALSLSELELQHCFYSCTLLETAEEGAVPILPPDLGRWDLDRGWLARLGDCVSRGHGDVPRAERVPAAIEEDVPVRGARGSCKFGGAFDVGGWSGVRPLAADERKS